MSGKGNVFSIFKPLEIVHAPKAYKSRTNSRFCVLRRSEVCKFGEGDPMLQNLSNKYLVMVFLTLLLAHVGYGQNTDCGVQPKISGEYVKADLDKLFVLVPEYFAAYKSRDVKRIASFIDKRHVNKIAARLIKKNTSERSKERIKDITGFCVESVDIFDGVVFAMMKGKISYDSNSRKNPGEFYFYVRKKDGEFSFSDLMFIEPEVEKQK